MWRTIVVASLYGIDGQEHTIWVFLEHQDGVLEGVSLELLSRGRQLADDVGWKLAGLLLGRACASLASEAFALGADEVVVGEHPLLDTFTVDAFTQVTFEAVMSLKPSIFLLGATPNGRDLAGRLAVRLRTGLTADCTDLRIDASTGNLLVGEVSGFGGGVLALITSPDHRPQMATVRPGVFPPGEAVYPAHGRIVNLPIDIDPADVRTRIVERVIGQEVDLTQVPALVVGGRGIEGRFDLMRKLAHRLGGDVGATRPPVDEGHIERERQIGQTGVVCRPKVAVVCGASGAFHFVVGIQEAGTVIAINSDPDAPIFEYADYGVVGDALQVVPALLKVLEQQGELVYA
jgi:electron transfer flavoprotein alpha subunit